MLCTGYGTGVRYSESKLLNPGRVAYLYCPDTANNRYSDMMTLIDIVLQPAIYWRGSNFGVDKANLYLLKYEQQAGVTRVEVHSKPAENAVPDRPQYAVSRHQVCVEILNRYGSYIELRSLLAEPFVFHQFYVVPGMHV